MGHPDRRLDVPVGPCGRLCPVRAGNQDPFRAHYSNTTPSSDDSSCRHIAASPLRTQYGVGTLYQEPELAAELLQTPKSQQSSQLSTPREKKKQEGFIVGGGFIGPAGHKPAENSRPLRPRNRPAPSSSTTCPALGLALRAVVSTPDDVTHRASAAASSSAGPSAVLLSETRVVKRSSSPLPCVLFAFLLHSVVFCWQLLADLAEKRLIPTASTIHQVPFLVHAHTLQ